MTLTRSQVASALAGQSFRFPDFEKVHKDWPFVTSPHVEWLREESDKFITWLGTQKWVIANREKVCKKLKATNMEIYLSQAFPDESKETQRDLLRAQLWLFLWDDEVDSFSGGLGEDFDAAQKFREDTLQYMKYALHLDKETSNLSNDVLITSFSAIADSLLTSPESSRRKFCDTLSTAIVATATEDKNRRSPYLPVLDEYLETRYHTIGIPTNIILHCVLIGSTVYNLPRKEIKELMYHTVMLVAMANDIFSLRKELQIGSPDSLVPILWQQHQDLQKAVDTVCSMMEDSRQAFDEAESSLLQDCPEEWMQQVQKFIRRLKTQVTGNYTWSLAAKRYGLAQFEKDGGYVVRL